MGFGLWVLTLIVALAPFVPQDFRSLFSDLWADFVFLPYLLVLALLNARRAATTAETRFWSLFGAALTTWLVVRVMFVAWPVGSWGVAEDVATDVLYGVFYLLLALALEMKPHGGPAHSPVLARSGDRVPIATTLIFFAAAVTYFVILPARQDPESYRYWLFSFGLYVALDLYLFGRVLALGSHRGGRWGRVYTWLAALFIMWALTDAAEGLVYADMLPWIEPGSMIRFDAGGAAARAWIWRRMAPEIRIWGATIMARSAWRATASARSSPKPGQLDSVLLKCGL